MGRTAKVTAAARLKGIARRCLGVALRIARPRLPREIGLFEALAYPWGASLEWTRRHALILAELERIRRDVGRDVLTVLDFGGGGGSLAAVMRLYGVRRHYRLILADVDRREVEAARLDDLLIEKHVLVLAGAIPLMDASIDVAVSSDVFEHIPPGARAHWAAELQRVARLGQVHTFPADSRDGRWGSTRADRALDAWFRAKFGGPERWTAEHLAHEQPIVEDMLELFPGSTVRGFANIGVWLGMLEDQLAGTNPIRRGWFALRYLMSARRLDRQPPFKGCLLIGR